MNKLNDVITAFIPEHFPKNFDYPEIPIVGRSNCGKSSLVNYLLNRKNIARCGKRPGVTISVNFYTIKYHHTYQYLVDLPGYGFSQSDINIKKTWDYLIRSYFRRIQITKVLFLMDIRRTLEDDDKFVLQNIINKYKIFVLLTKADKVCTAFVNNKYQELEKHLNSFNINIVKILPISIKSKQNLNTLKKIIF